MVKNREGICIMIIINENADCCKFHYLNKIWVCSLQKHIA